MLVAGCSKEAAERGRMADAVRAFAEGSAVPVTYVTYATMRALLADLMGTIAVPDVVLLDADSLGGDAGKRARDAGYAGVLVFVSGTERHALPAFDADAFNYVLEGDRADDGRFRRVMASACEAARRRGRRCLLLNGVSEHRSVPIDSIDYFEVDLHVCSAHLDDGSRPFEFLSSLEAIEGRLAQYGFVRCHRAYVVNARKIAMLEARGLTLVDGTRLPVGRSRRQEVRDVYRQVLGLRADADVVPLGDPGRRDG